MDSNKHRVSMDALPIEVLRWICDLLTKNELLVLCHVSKRFQLVLKERLYKSIVFADHQYEMHLMTLKKYYNQHSYKFTVLQSEVALDILLNSLRNINRDNQRLIKEFKTIVSVDSTFAIERKIRELLSFNLSMTLLMVPTFKRYHLCFDASCLRWLSVGEIINSSFDRDIAETTGRKLRANRLEMLHIRSFNEDFPIKVIESIEGLNSVTSLKLTGTAVDDDYQQYPNHLEETANLFILNHNLQKLNNGNGFNFPNLKYLTLQKFQFAKTPYRKWSSDIRFVDFAKLNSLALLNCKHEGHDVELSIQNFFLEIDFSNLQQLVFEHSSIVHPNTIMKMKNIKRFHMSRGGLTYTEITKMVLKLNNLEIFSMNDSKLMRDFHRIFNSHRESNVLFSRKFLNEYQFQPTQPIFKYSEEELTRLLNCYKITTDYIATDYDNDVNPFDDIYFNDKSFINSFLKETFKPFKEEIDSKILPIAQNLFQSNLNLKYVKICGIGFKLNTDDSCYLDV